MCKWYCLSEGPSTNLKCLHCGVRYCAACLHGDFPGRMESLIKCGRCGKKPQVRPNSQRSGWKDVPSVETPVSAAANVRVNRMSDQEAGDLFLTNLRADPPPVRSPVAGRRSQSPTPSNRSSMAESESTALHHVYVSFCNFGEHATELDGAKFVKMFKDCGLSPYTLSVVDAELIFFKSKPNDERKLSFEQFDHALHLVAQKIYPGENRSDAYDRVVNQILSCPRPKAQGTAAHAGGIFAKLTDPSLYTGAHKYRFDENGHGLGLAGRDSIAKGGGHVPHRI